MTRGLTRRGLMVLLGGAPVAACAGMPQSALLNSARPPTPPPFAHGVASGDAEARRVVIWTRVSQPQVAAVDWEVSDDRTFSRLAASGRLITDANRDWTVKADAGGLRPGTAYFYRFRCGGAVSPVGRTKTLPEGKAERLRLAAVSCAHLAHGYFNVYDHIARRSDLDAVIHLGDYFYSQKAGGFAGAPDEIAGRVHRPAHEAATLTDYRARHAQYKEDPALQALHAAHPVYAIWDDHEFANDASRTGAPGHEGDAESWRTRQTAALKAWHEWMPVREAGGDPARRYMTARFGDLATICFLETRASARDASIGFGAMAAQAADADGIAALKAVFTDEPRQKLGPDQLALLGQDFRSSGNGWLILANPTLMADVRTPDVRPYLSPDALAELKARWSEAEGFLAAAEHGLPLLPDSWDGYAAERERLYAALAAAGRRDALVLTGDTHSWWVNTLSSADGSPAGVELAVSSVSAPSALGSRLIGNRSRDLALLVTRDNPAVRYVSGETHGYLDLELGPDEGMARFLAVDSVAGPDYRVFEEARFRLSRKEGRLKTGGPRGLGLRQRWLFRA